MTDPIPRLAFEETAPELQALLKPTVDRLGYFGEFFQYAGHLPQAVTTFMAYTGAVKAPLSDAENELLALAVCGRMEAAYERIQHERLSRKLGFPLAWIAAASGREPPGEGVLQPGEAALLGLAHAVVDRRGEGVAAEIEAVAALLGPVKALAALLQISRFMGIAVMNKALAMRLPVPSVFDEAAG